MRFDNVFQAIDAAMLFGARLEINRSRPISARMMISRNLSSARPITYVVMLMYTHGIELSLTGSLATYTDNQKIDFKSKQTFLLTTPAERWYRQVGNKRQIIHMPDRLELTEQMVAVWLVDAFAQHRVIRVNRRKIALTGPTTNALTTENAINQLESLGLPWTVEPNTESATLKLVVNEEEVAEDWLKQFIPKAVWEPL